MATRRDYGSGSITQLGPRRWRLRWSDGLDPVTGKQVRRSRTIEGTKTEAQRLLAQLAATKTSTRQTSLCDLIERWSATAGHADSTSRNYQRALDVLPDPIRQMRIDRIRVDTLDELYARLVADGVSRHRVATLHAVISGALTQACRWQWLTSNPAQWARPPAIPRRQADGPDLNDVRRLLAAASRDPQLHAWVRLAVATGARRSEVLALHWADLDLDAQLVHIRLALEPYLPGELKLTKTERARRPAIDAGTVDVLRRWRLAAQERALAVGARIDFDTAFVFSDQPALDEPWRPDLGTRRWARLRKAAKVTAPIRLGDLRHASPTWLLSRGIDARTIAERLGHTRTATTTDTYAHVIPATDRHAADILGELLG